MINFCKLMLEEMLEMSKNDPLRPGLFYRSAYDFVFRHGKEYKKPMKLWRYKGLMPQQKCFANAILIAARENIKYVEGFALSPEGETILHAWNVDADDELLDTTWGNTGIVYYGVEFSLERADDAMWNGDACVLNDSKRNYPVFQDSWKGENYSLQWPHSDRLDFYEGKSKKIPASIKEFELKSVGSQQASEKR